jgi:uncharacterized phage protein (TIGR01671 family)
MREILFRGKRMDNGEWVEGSLLKATINGKTAYLIFGDNFSFDGNDVKALSHALVDPATVGQYTGLTDKNGKRIFEGDIVTFKTRVGSFKPHCVRWYEEDARFLVAGIDGVRSYPMDKAWEYEVLGNIHDRPELIGGTE